MRPWFPPSWTRPEAVVSPDDTRTCGMCGTALKADGKSLDFCHSSCQDQWNKMQADPTSWSTSLPADDHALSERIRTRLGLPDPGKDAA